MLNQVLFIVWRESVEAILVIGIVYAWLRQSDSRVGLRYLWFGVLGGLALAGALGVAIMTAQSWLQGIGEDIFQTAMVLIACVLIVQMVFWMRSHGRHMKADLERGLAESVSHSHYWGIALLVAIAVAREGSETVVFLYGMGAAQLATGGLLAFIGAAFAGFVLALLTFYLLQLGTRLFSWQLFFRITEILLLLLAASLLVGGVERLIGLEVLPAGADPLWDTSALLDDSSGIGALLATFAGYRAYPPFTVVLAYALYWVVIAILMRQQKGRKSTSGTNTDAVPAD